MVAIAQGALMWGDGVKSSPVAVTPSTTHATHSRRAITGRLTARWADNQHVASNREFETVAGRTTEDGDHGLLSVRSDLFSGSLLPAMLKAHWRLTVAVATPKLPHGGNGRTAARPDARKWQPVTSSRFAR